MSMMQRSDEITLRFLAQPSTVNFGGKVHGGTVMSWIDQAAYAVATTWAQRYCVTAYVGGIRFVNPIVIGDVVEVEARIACTGNSSMTIAVDVRSGDLKGGQLEITTECAVVMVSVDSHGKAVSVKAFKPTTDAEIALAAEAKRRLGARDRGS